MGNERAVAVRMRVVVMTMGGVSMIVMSMRIMTRMRLFLPARLAKERHEHKAP